MSLASLLEQQSTARWVRILTPIIGVFLVALLASTLLFWIAVTSLATLPSIVTVPIWFGISIWFLFIAYRISQKYKRRWLDIQADFVKQWTEGEYNVTLEPRTDVLDEILQTGTGDIIRSWTGIYKDHEYRLLLTNYELGDKNHLCYYWYTEQPLDTEMTGVTYIVGEGDFQHRLFNKSEAEMTLMEWGDFEELLHVETIDGVEARYLLPPDVMEKIYDTWSSNTQSIMRMKFADQKVRIMAGSKLPGDRENVWEQKHESKTLLHDEGPEKMQQALRFLDDMRDVIQVAHRR